MADLPTPITRVDKYLAYLCGAYSGELPNPIAREDWYLTFLCGVDVASLPTPITRTDRYLAYLCGTYDGDLPTPIARKDYYLATLCGTYSGDLPTPTTRAEKYLAQLVEDGGVFYEDKVASGVTVEVDDALARAISSLTLYGWSTQVTTTGAQLYDADSDVSGYVNATSGKVQTAGEEAQERCSDYISLADIENITASATVDVTSEQQIHIHFGWYDADKGFISMVFVNGGVGKTSVRYTEAVPDDASYCRVSWRTYGLENSRIMVNSGTEALTWEPYTGGVVSPSPAYPQDIASAADSGEVNVSVSDGGDNVQTLVLAAENGLPGIPVSSGGSYTDDDGQMWIADEIRLNEDGTGVYVQRLYRQTLTVDTMTSTYYVAYRKGLCTLDKAPLLYTTVTADDNAGICLSNKFRYDSDITYVNMSGTAGLIMIYRTTNGLWRAAITSADASVSADTSASAVKALQSEIGDDAYVIYPLATPVETSLTADEIAAFLALRTYSGTTIITNDADAYMEVGYKAKKE